MTPRVITDEPTSSMAKYVRTISAVQLHNDEMLISCQAVIGDNINPTSMSETDNDDKIVSDCDLLPDNHKIANIRILPTDANIDTMINNVPKT